MACSLRWCVLGLLLGCSKEYELMAQQPDVDPGEVTPCGFTPVPGTQLSEYDCNPVFPQEEGMGEDWWQSVHSVGFHTTEVFGHPMYQIWYSAGLYADDEDSSAGGWYGLGYALSEEGTNWEVHPSNPLLEAPDDGWNQDGMSTLQVVWDVTNRQYVMAYQGYKLDAGIIGMGVATSDDGVRWSQHPGNPVMDLSDVSSGHNWCWPLALTANAQGGMTGYLAGGETGFGDSTCDVYPVQISALDQWSPLSQPALEAGPEVYDQQGIAAATVVQHADTHYMFYVGFTEWETLTVGDYQYVTPRFSTLSLATSASGISWDKHPDNPLPIHRTTEGEITAVAAQVVGKRIHLWVTDYYADIDRHAVGYYLFEPLADPHL